jgi:hypothetical protein
MSVPAGFGALAREERMSKTDIGVPEPKALVFEEDGFVKAAVEYSRAVALSAHDWYAHERKGKRNWAKRLRFLAIVATAIAGIIPLLTEIFKNGAGAPLFSPAWSSVALAVAGSLVLFDRFFGCSTGWLRFTDAMTRIRFAICEFDMDLMEMKGRSPDGWQTEKALCDVIARCKKLMHEVNDIVMTETQKWDDEFRKAIQKIDEAAAKKAEKERRGETGLQTKPTEGGACGDAKPL